MEATYISNNSFSVEGDRTSDFVTNRRLKLDCGIDGIYYASIETSVSGVLTTTITIDEDVLTSNLTTVLYSPVKPGGAGNLPNHFHTNSEGDGGYIAEPIYVFTDLTDTPSTYLGTEGQYLQSTGSGIVWATISGGGGDVTSEDLTTLSGALQTQIDNFEGYGASTFLDLTDTPSTYDGATGKYLVVTTSGIDFTTIDSQSIIGQATTLTVTGTMSPGDYYSFRVDDKQYNYSFNTTDDFLSFDTNLWYKTSDTALTSITETKPGLRYFISDQITGNTYIYIMHKLFLEGDYSITLYGTVVNCNYEGSGIELAINNSSHTSLGYLKAGYASGSKFMCSFGTYTTATRSNASFALRIVRSGSTIYSKYSDGQTGSFNTLRTDTLSTASHTIVIGVWASASITSDQVVLLEKVVLDYSGTSTLDPAFETPTISGMMALLASDVSYYSNIDTDYTSDTLSINSNSVFALSNVVNFDVNTVYSYLTQPNVQSFLDLNDTPSTYSGTEGQYLQSTGFGTVWSVISGGGGDVTSEDLTTLSGILQTQINLKQDLGSYAVWPYDRQILPIINPSAETGDTTGWIDITGGIGVKAGGFDGAYYFFGGPNAITESYQEVTLISGTVTTDLIDSGTAELVVDFYASGYISDSDSVKTAVVFYNTLDVALNPQIYSEAYAYDDWTLVSNTYNIPSTARYFRLYFYFTRYSGTNNDGYIDSIIAYIPVWATQLEDIVDIPTPISGNFLKCKDDASGYEWATISGGGGGTSNVQSFLDLNDTPSTYSDGQYLRTTASGISAIDGIILKAPNDSEWLIKVTNSGTLYTVGV